MYSRPPNSRPTIQTTNEKFIAYSAYSLDIYIMNSTLLKKTLTHPSNISPSVTNQFSKRTPQNWHSTKTFYDILQWSMYSVSQKKSPLRGPDISHFSHKRLRSFKRFFTHLLYVPIYARLQIFIQLSPTLTQLCHIKLDYPVHIICAKCPKCAKTRAFRRFRKSLIDLLTVVCGK